MAYLFLFIAGFLWGTSFIAGKFAFTMFDPVLVVAIRFSIAAIFWLFYLQRKRIKITWQDIKTYAGVAIMTIPMTYLIQYIGLQKTSASSGAMMLGAIPIVIVTVNALVFNEKPKKRDIISVILVTVGITFIIGNLAGVETFGTTLVLISAFIAGSAVSWSKHLMKELNPVDFSAITTIIGTVMILPAIPFLVKSYEIKPSIEGVVAVLYLAIGCSILAILFWNIGTHKARANTTSLFIAFEPLFGVFFGFLILGDSLQWFQLIGFACILLPVAIGSYLDYQEHDPVEHHELPEIA